MINQITVNSNNTIQLSRGQLLAWLNQLLNANITKIQQLGTGAIYCQMLDLLYPGKVQLSKVNFKAKNDYQYINNFKLLQQYFTKFGIMKNIEVQKLIKCKYQDNLQFLQWFKKIFDNHYNKNDHDASMRRSASDNQSIISLQKQNKKPIRALNFDGNDTSKNNINELLKLQFSKQDKQQRPAYTTTSRSRYDQKLKRQNSLLKPSTERNNSFEIKANISTQNMEADQANYRKSNTISQNLDNSKNKEPYYSPSKFIQKQNFYKPLHQDQGFCNEERQFYLKKFRQIEHLMEIYQNNQHCSKLIDSIRKVIFITPQIKDWTINQQTGEFVCSKESQYEKIHQISKFSQFAQPIKQNIQLE